MKEPENKVNYAGRSREANLRFFKKVVDLMERMIITKNIGGKKRTEKDNLTLSSNPGSERGPNQLSIFENPSIETLSFSTP